MSMCTFTKSYSDSNEIGLWIEVNEWQCVHDPIEGQVQGHERFFFSFQNRSSPPFAVGAGKWLLILKLEHNIFIPSSWIFDVFSSFCITWLNLGENSDMSLKFVLLRSQWNLVCRVSLISDARPYVIWPDLMSRSHDLESWKFLDVQQSSTRCWPSVLLGANFRNLHLITPLLCVRLWFDYYLINEYDDNMMMINIGTVWCRWRIGSSSWLYREEEWWSSGKKAGSIYNSVSLSVFFFL